jgi:hypothetical protein
MKLQEKPPELDGNRCPACADNPPDLRVEKSQVDAAPTQLTGSEILSSALRLVETENASLRRLIVDLIHENQQLRQRSAPRNEHGTQSSLAS